MFGWGRARARLRAAGGIAGGLPARLSGMGALERATVLVLANALLDLGARLHDPALREDPRAARPPAAHAALGEMTAAFLALSDLCLREDLPRRRHAECHREAAAVALCSVAAGLDPAALPPVRAAWKALWAARAEVPRAVEWIRRYERAAGVEAVPRGADGAPPGDLDLRGFGARVPGFLRAGRG